MSTRQSFAGGTLVTLDPAGTLARADLLVEDGRIVAAGGPFEDAEQVDCRGALVLPGFVQAHVHLCQALFRGLAEETDLLVWLSRKIWPLEAAHTPESLAVSARLGLAELIRGGATTIHDMGSVPHASTLIEVARDSGVRAVMGQLLMDTQEGAPEALRQSPEVALAEAARLAERHHGSAGGRVRVALAPRFVLSCSREMLLGVARLSAERGLVVHTHLNESRGEVAATEKLLGRATVAFFDEMGLLNERLVAAHGVWFTDEERALLAQRGAAIVHCPTANLKLASGVCDVRALLDAGVRVALGSDGLPCNNRADALAEMRQAGLMSRYLRGAEALTAEEVVRLATTGGARALGLEDQIGSLEVGKRADVVVLDAAGALLPGDDPYTAIVYQMSSEHVRHVAVDGRLLLRDWRLEALDEERVGAEAVREREALLQRARLAVG